MDEKIANKKSNLKLILILTLVVVILGVIVYFAIKENDRPSYSFADEEEMYGIGTYREYLEQNQDDRLNYFTLKIYDAFYYSIYDENGDYKEDGLKSGESTIYLADYLSTSDLSEVEDYIAVATSGALSALTFDNPELFWLSFENMAIYMTSSGFAYISMDERNNPTDFYAEWYSNEFQIDYAILQLRQAREEVYSQLNTAYPDGANDYQKVMFFNDYLVDNVEYDLTVETDGTGEGLPFVHTAYGALVNGLAVCDGYSYAVKYLLDGQEITNLVGAGYMIQNGQPGGHMWSYVYLYDNWYGLDVTWNDPTFSEESFAGLPYTEEQKEQFKEEYTNLHRHDYLLLGGNLESGTGFYDEERIPQNYIYYFDNGSSYYQFPIPKISETDFVYPSIRNVRILENSDGTVQLSVDCTGLKENYVFAIAKSTDGVIYGEFTPCEQSIIFTNVEDSGYYKIRLQTAEGEVLCEYNDAVTVTVTSSSEEASINLQNDIFITKEQELVA